MDQINYIDNLPANRWEEFKKIKIESFINEPSAFTFDLEKVKSEPETYWKEILENALKGESGLILAELEGKLVGFGRIYFFKDIKFKHNSSLESLYVSPEYRNKGIGKALIEKRIELISKRPEIKNIITEIFSSQVESIELHKKLRFEIIGVFKDFVCIEGKYFDSVHFLKKLKP